MSDGWSLPFAGGGASLGAFGCGWVSAGTLGCACTSGGGSSMTSPPLVLCELHGLVEVGVCRLSGVCTPAMRCKRTEYLASPAASWNSCTSKWAGKLEPSACRTCMHLHQRMHQLAKGKRSHTHTHAHIPCARCGAPHSTSPQRSWTSPMRWTWWG